MRRYPVLEGNTANVVMHFNQSITLYLIPQQMKKFKVKLGLARLTAIAVLALARDMVSKMTGNAFFLTPDPPLLDVTASADALEVAINNATKGGELEHEIKRVALIDTVDVLSRLGIYIQGTSNGNREQIISSGAGVAKEKDPIGPLDAPESLEATVSNFSGTIDLDWNGVHGSRMYNVYINENDPNDEAAWSLAYATTKSTCAITDLTPGKFYWFRITAVGTAGSSPASDPAKSYAA